jgi:hypothetical protein
MSGGHTRTLFNSQGRNMCKECAVSELLNTLKVMLRACSAHKECVGRVKIESKDQKRYLEITVKHKVYESEHISSSKIRRYNIGQGQVVRVQQKDQRLKPLKYLGNPSLEGM